MADHHRADAAEEIQKESAVVAVGAGAIDDNEEGVSDVVCGGDSSTHPATAATTDEDVRNDNLFSDDDDHDDDDHPRQCGDNSVSSVSTGPSSNDKDEGCEDDEVEGDVAAEVAVDSDDSLSSMPKTENADSDGNGGPRGDETQVECHVASSSVEEGGLNRDRDHDEDDFDADALAGVSMRRWSRPASTSTATFVDRHHPATSRFHSLHHLSQQRRGHRGQHHHHNQLPQRGGCRPLFTIVIPTQADAPDSSSAAAAADVEAGGPSSSRQSPGRKSVGTTATEIGRRDRAGHHPEYSYETDDVSDNGSDDFHGDGDRHLESSLASPAKEKAREQDKDGGFHSQGVGLRSNGNLPASAVSSNSDGAGTDATVATGGDRRGQGQGQCQDQDQQVQDRDDERGHDTGGRDADEGDPYAASPDSKYYPRYAVRVNRRQNDRSNEIALYSLARPHMRAFHSSWIGFFVAFFVWFAITPLLSEVQVSLLLSKEQIWTSSIAGTAGTIVMRVVMGPLCDKYGARTCMSAVLIASAVPAALTGLVRTSTGLSVLRLFVGVAGSSFVACQYWTSVMFVREAAGTANALVSGWGNLGGGVTQIVMGSAVFPLLKAAYGGSSDKAWRTACIVPAVLSVLTAVVIFRRSDDCPKGNYRKMTRRGSMIPVSAKASLASAARESDAWILALQYGCCFGVEVTMNNAAALYFKEEFDQTTEAAAAIASVFGWMNLFARGLGGFGSDMSNYKHGRRGRLGWQFVNLFLQGVTILIFGSARSLGGAIFVMILFSVFVQSAEGSTYGIVPSVHPRFTGGVVGIVAAGGNVGGVVFAIVFREFDYRHAFNVMGVAVIFSSLFSFFVKVGEGAGGGAARRRCCLCCPLGSPPPLRASRQEMIGEEEEEAQGGNFVSSVVNNSGAPG